MSKAERLDEINKIAISHGGRCLSDEYNGLKLKLRFVCEKFHEWEATADSIKYAKSWCPYCSKYSKGPEKHLKNIETAKSVAINRGGKCLTEHIDQVIDYFEWECSNGHRWKAKYHNVINGSWCPHCKIFYGESICREYFEYIFKKQFPKVRPDFLVNPSTGRKLELDGYCSELGIAFEYNGIYHYEKIFEDQDLENQIKIDKLKIKLCKKNNIKLIVVPAIYIKIKLKNLHLFLEKEFEENKIVFDRDRLFGVYDNKIEELRIYNPDSKITIKDVIKLVESKGGKCLTNIYVSSSAKIPVECSCGNVWEVSYSKLKMGRWCPECSRISGANNRRFGIDHYQKIAASKNGECLSKDVSGCYDSLKFKCEFGHIFETRAINISYTWCPECGKNNCQRDKFGRFLKENS